MTPLFDSYDAALKSYKTARALGDWTQARFAAEQLIELRPCEEAVPVLVSYLDEARAAQERSESRLLKWLRSIGIRWSVTA